MWSPSFRMTATPVFYHLTRCGKMNHIKLAVFGYVDVCCSPKISPPHWVALTLHELPAEFMVVDAGRKWTITFNGTVHKISFPRPATKLLWLNHLWFERRHTVCHFPCFFSNWNYMWYQVILCLAEEVNFFFVKKCYCNINCSTTSHLFFCRLHTHTYHILISVCRTTV